MSLCFLQFPFMPRHVTERPSSSWEFVITLGFEWDVIRGRRRCRWTFWVCNDETIIFPHREAQKADFFFLQIYSLARVAGLTSVIIGLVFLNRAVIITCQVCIYSILCQPPDHRALNCQLKVMTKIQLVSTSPYVLWYPTQRSELLTLRFHSSRSPPAWPLLLPPFYLCSACMLCTP